MIGLIAALAAGAPALAQSPYPASADRAGVTAWVRDSTNLAPEQVVAVSASAATAIVGRMPAANGHVEARLRALALTPEASIRSGVVAWEAPLEIDCRTAQVRLGATIGYASRTSADGAVSLAPSEAAWRTPKTGTILDAAWRSVCDKSFAPPLAAGVVRVAQAPSPRAPPAPLGPATPVRPATLVRAAVPAAAFARDASVEAPPPPSPVARGGRAAVQVVSSPKAAETRQTLAILRGRYGALQGLETRVEPAQVRGRTVYRGLFAGFTSRQEAAAFCQTLKQSGRDCLAR